MGCAIKKQVKEGFANELALLKIRYKDPVVKDAKSVEESTPIPFSLTDLTQTMMIIALLSLSPNGECS